MARPADPDKPRTLIFIDMLGFGALTLQCQTRPLHSEAGDPNRWPFRTKTFSSRLAVFQHVLDKALADYTRFGISAMVFSDCAYLDIGETQSALSLAGRLMCMFIENYVPVRMGVGRGTFYGIRHSTEVLEGGMISKSLFAGSAVVHAYNAERCGAKGCRILLSPSLEIQQDTFYHRRILLPVPLKDITHELAYITSYASVECKPSFPFDTDLRAVKRIQAMRDNSEDAPEVAVHYADTLAAFARMRSALGRTRPLDEIEADEARPGFWRQRSRS